MRKLKLDELNRVDLEAYKKQEKLPIVVVMDNIRSMHNIGSVFRTCDAFLIDTIYLCGITAKPPHKEIRKTAIGATESVSWQYKENTQDLIQNLKKEGYEIISIEQVAESISLEEFQILENKKYALIFGNEVNGVDDEVVNESDMCLEIPQMGTKHSLNISVCAGVVLWTFFSQMKF